MSPAERKDNPMRALQIEKVVVNIGVGDAGEQLMKGERVLRLLTGAKPVRTISRTTNRDLGIRKGSPIGCKVTLRGESAVDFLKRAFWIKNNKIASYSFDREGNFSFGVGDYTDFQGMRYDPQIGIFGLDISTVLTRKGKRVSQRRRARTRVPKRHRVTQSEAIKFVERTFEVEVVKAT